MSNLYRQEISSSYINMSSNLHRRLLQCGILLVQRNNNLFAVVAHVHPESLLCANCVDLRATGDVDRFGRTNVASEPEFFDPQTCLARYCRPAERYDGRASPGGIAAYIPWPSGLLQPLESAVSAVWRQVTGAPVTRGGGKTSSRSSHREQQQPVQPPSDEDHVDLRVTKGYGSKPYETVRISVITKNHAKRNNYAEQDALAKVNKDDPSTTTTGATASSSSFFDYSAPFKWVWTQFSLHTTLKNVEAGKPTDFNFHVVDAKQHKISITLPKQGQPVSGVLMGDPCVGTPGVVQLVGCMEGKRWDLERTLPTIVDLFVGQDPNTHYWGWIGDNFYDRDGTVTQEIYDRIPLKTKEKMFLTVAGNHDYWVQGAPVRAVPEDQCANGFAQYYGMDMKSAKDQLPGSASSPPYDLSIDPSAGKPNECLYTKKENTFFYQQIGNTGFIGYSSVYDYDSMKADFTEACDSLWAEQTVDLLMVVSHWNKDQSGSAKGMDAQNIAATLVKEIASCKKFHEEQRVTFIMGHEHCAHPAVNNYMPGPVAGRTGFLIGSFGMDDWVCPDGNYTSHTYGIPVFDTSGGMFTVWYFLLHQNEEDKFEAVKTCLAYEGTWKLCTHLATLWHERKLPPRKQQAKDGTKEQQASQQMVSPSVGEDAVTDIHV
ncbi:unnamed protein product [Amoebophrya sp. A25]|nr:unnamed protein product [Amoebophrya sp. A25]|eukprot:GSA25T00019018001.1